MFLAIWRAAANCTPVARGVSQRASRRRASERSNFVMSHSVARLIAAKLVKLRKFAHSSCALWRSLVA